MKIVVSGASGFVGRPLLAALRRDGHEVLQLVRRPPRGPTELQWDPASGHLPAATRAALAGTEAAVNLSGSGPGDRRWTARYRRVIRDSRVQTTHTLAAALAGLDPLPKVLLNASGTAIYGDRGDELLTEGSAPRSRFLADVVRDWEAATAPAADAGIRVCTLRSAMVLGSDGGAFGRRLLPLFRLGLGGRFGDGRMWWSWITLEDQLRAIRFLLDAGLDGPVNTCSPQPVRNADLTRALARAVHRPAPFVVPRWALRVGLGGFAEEILASQRVLPAKLLDAGFTFRHPTVDEATAWLASRPAQVLEEDAVR